MSLPVVDSHVHLWKPDRLSYDWLKGMPTLNRPHGPAEYAEATADIPVSSLVFVECTESFDDAVAREEVRWVQSLAEEEPRIDGIVAHASLEKGRESREHLDWLSDQPLVTGVRRILQDEADEFALQPDFVEGVQLLTDYDFSFDLTVRAPQLPSVLELVDRCPEVAFVLDHIGKPHIREGLLEPWTSHLASLAQREHVACKLSGVLTEADPDDWSRESVAPYLHHALDAFGPERLLFGGDWPVLRLAASYSTWMALVHSLIEDLSRAEQRRILGENARRVYDLSESPPSHSATESTRPQ